MSESLQSNMKIGFFDSGLGGLTILRSVAQGLPQYDYEYYGDTANLPYGDKTEEEIYELTRAGMQHLFERDCMLVIIACNTSSAETLRRLQDNFLVESYPDRRILGVIIPTVEAVVGSGLKQIGMLATRRTVESHKYERELMKFENAPVLTAVATPGLVPRIEAGEIDHALALAGAVVDALVSDHGITGLILGCTHYTTLKEGLAARYPTLMLFSQDDIIPAKLTSYLEAHPEHEGRLGKGGSRNIHLTKHRPEYDTIIANLLGGAFLPLDETGLSG